MISAIIGAISFTPVIILYFLIILGAPVGEYVMGGKNRIIPKESRPPFITALIVQLILLFILLQVGGIIPFLLEPPLTCGIGYFFALYLLFNAAISLFSFSRKEKLFVAPLYLITSICFWATLLLNS
ncbi:MAG TPA: hypothetical protein PK366_05695 [Fibrobacteraceae bacterium]|mgnify:FL=1|jgi:heme A synthase|nr:hypothetical protein [Fibrobacteraceae bacterium]